MIFSIFSLQTNTLFTMFELLCICGTPLATVTIIPPASLVVVAIVADAIAFEYQDFASRFLEVGVQTLALEAELELVHIACVATAVATVPTTAASVVTIITVMVTLVFGRKAFALALLRFFVGIGVETCTIITVPVRVLRFESLGATVAAVVFTFRHVVYIVTEAVVHVVVDTFGSLVIGVQT